MDNNALVLIPALKKHAVIPDQLVKRMAGVTLIQRALNTALAAFSAENILVVTDSQEIGLIAERNGVRALYSPDLRLNSLDIVAGLKAVLAAEATRYDPLLIYRASCPLLRSADLLDALDKFAVSGGDVMVSVKNVRQRVWEAREGGLAAILDDGRGEMLVESKALIILRAYAVLSDDMQTDTPLRIMPYFLNDRAVEINSYQDWWICERLLQRRHVVFVVAGYPAIGMGHVYRALMLAHEIAHHKISFMCTRDSELAVSSIAARDYRTHMQTTDNLAVDILALKPDLVVNDMLDTAAAYMDALKVTGVPVVNFEDLGPGAVKADLVINALYDPGPDPRVLSGPSYFCLRDEFINATRNDFQDKPGCVLITFGGTDVYDYTRQTLDVVEPLCRERDVRIRIVAGPGYAHREKLEAHLAALQRPYIEFTCATNAMSRMMEGVDVSIVSAGRTVYELAHMRVPSLVLAQHEREARHTFARPANGFAYMGVMQPTFRAAALRRSFIALLDNPALRRKLFERQARIDFTANKARVVARMTALLEDTVQG